MHKSCFVRLKKLNLGKAILDLACNNLKELAGECLAYLEWDKLTSLNLCTPGNDTAKNPLHDKGIHDLMGLHAKNLSSLNLSTTVHRFRKH